jgi:hypothetical protein
MAAGLGYIEFATGDVLTASAANGYLASQVVMVFASSSARSTAITSPQEGMISYLKDTNAVEYYSGSAWTAVGGGTSGGMTLLSTTTLSGSSTSISVSPSSYKNLEIWVEGVEASSNPSLYMGINSDTTAANYRNSWSGSVGYGYSSGYDNTLAGVTVGLFPGVNGIKASSPNNFFIITIPNPNSTKSKPIAVNGSFYNDSNSESAINVTCSYVTTSAISSLQFKSNQSLTGGTVKIYGVN